ncbi:MAG: Maf family protein [Armatimonadota bacterium]|nr:Maf family protein [Armatimonadota bacterium]
MMISSASVPLILASASPRRRELVALLGIPFRVEPADIDETPPDGHSPEEVARTLAREKALVVSRRQHRGIVLGADTIVVCDEAILGKPRDAEEALQMLRRLNGREHQVLTGVALLDVVDGVVVREQCEAVCTRVWFRRVDEEHLRRYVATGEPMDKAGAYGAQGYGSTLIERIEGCYFNVVGLPVSRVCAMLEAWEVVVLQTVRTS